MMTDHLDEDRRSIFCGGLSPKVTEDVLYELFLQAGPIAKLALPKDQMRGGNRGFGFVTFAHPASVKYAIDLLDDIPLFDRRISVRTRNNVPADESPAQPETPQDFMLNVSALTPMEQPFMMPSPMQFGNPSFNMYPFGNMPMYPSQMADNTFNQADRSNNCGTNNWNSYNQNRNNRNYEERNFDRSFDRNYDRSKERNQDRNFDRGNDRDHGRSHSRSNDRNHDRNHDRNDRNSERSYDRNRSRHDRNFSNNHGGRNFDRNRDYGNSSNDRDYNQSRKREFSSSDDYSSHKKRRHR